MRKVSLKYPSQGLVHFLNVANDEDKEQILNDMIKLKDILQKHPMGHARLNIVNYGIDKLMKMKTTEKIACSKGCSSCCHIPVTLTKSEGMVIANLAKKMDLDMEMIKKQATAKTVDEYNQLPIEERACVFLKDNICSIYEDRPVYCRTFRVISDPAHCNTEHEDKVRQYLDLKAEILHNALINCEGETRTDYQIFLPQRILEFS